VISIETSRLLDAIIIRGALPRRPDNSVDLPKICRLLSERQICEHQRMAVLQRLLDYRPPQHEFMRLARAM
jgi:hypothetical protein